MDKDKKKQSDEPTHSLDLLIKAQKNEIRTRFQYFLIALIFSIPFFLQILTRLFGYSFELPNLIQWGLCTLILFGCGIPLFKEGVKGKINELLIIIGCISGYLLSLAGLLGIFNYRYFEFISAVMTLNLLGNWYDSLSKGLLGTFLIDQMRNNEIKMPLHEWKATIEKNNPQTQMQPLLEKICKYYLFIVLGLTILILFGWIFFDKWGYQAVLNSLAVLMIACSGLYNLSISLIGWLANSIYYKSKKNLLFENESFAQLVKNKIKLNFVFVFIFNIMAIPLAALGFLDLATADWTLAASLSTLMANSLLIRNWKPVDHSA